ncbi:type IV pilus biogenesis protein PilP [Azotobacter vinelandii]|uniref:type IV pilus biogenesis protein PilP n=1 Tax=Azotobacter vinelandii TaxID=354 RepID=UPI000923B16D|nr:type IV pilus biogenesis protein PilP [Azotobacter vinelandii]WKN23190.1 type IV pilus biogenesis protein PilP [Azotobacter vinelandii]SFY09054.1 type IV pilus biogenesis protein PilP [Azotobacter vinelandii]
MRNNFTPALAAMLMSFGLSSHAAEPQLSGIQVGELGRLQSETILFKAQAERAKAERSINQDDSPRPQAASNGNGFAGGAGLPQLQTPPAAAPVRSTAPASQDLPVVRAITGSSRRLQATLLYSSGIEIEASTNTRELPGGYRIAHISLDGVILERSGKQYPLGFSNRAPTYISTQEVVPQSVAPAPQGLIDPSSQR